MTKLSVLHTTTELNNLDRFFSDEKTENRDVYRGFHIFPSKSVVMSRYKEGKPLSCFVLDNHKDEVHVAFFEKNDRSQNQLSYATFSYDTTVAQPSKNRVFIFASLFVRTHIQLWTGMISTLQIMQLCYHISENRPTTVQHSINISTH